MSFEKLNKEANYYTGMTDEYCKEHIKKEALNTQLEENL